MNAKTVRLLERYAGAFNKNYRKLKKEYKALPYPFRAEYEKRLRKELKMEEF